MTRSRPGSSSAIRRAAKVPGIIWLIILLCLIPELLFSGSDLGIWGARQWRQIAFQYGGFWIGLLGNWQPNFSAQPYTMFISYGFLHAGPVHFLVNALTLLSLGSALAGSLSKQKLLLLYLLSLIGGALGFAALASSVAPMIGASGALFGLAGALLAQEFLHRSARSRSLWPVFQAVAGLIALNAVLWWAMHGQLAWQTHLGGFVAGWVFVAVTRPKPA